MAMKLQTVGKVVPQEQGKGPRRRMIVSGKRQDGRWKVRTSLWRYLAETALSPR